MLHRAGIKGLIAATVMASAVMARAVVVDTVPIGNPGNAGDTRQMQLDQSSGYGAVAYSFEMGKYEITTAQYTAFLNAVAADDPYGLYDTRMDYYANVSKNGCNIVRGGTPGDYVYSVPDDWKNRPVNYVSWPDAVRFCNWLHNNQPSGVLTGTASLDAGLTEDGSYFLNATGGLYSVSRKATATWVLPNENEWYKSAYYDPNKPGGAGYWRFATGSDAYPGGDASETTNPGHNANYLVRPECNYVVGAPYYRTNVGEFELSASPYGTFDQNGNVGEWYEGDYTACVRDGGTYDTDYSHLAADWRNDAIVGGLASQSSRFGFRVALVPEPGSIALSLVGGLSLLGYAWRRRKQAA